jgi:hypothetical protein
MSASKVVKAVVPFVAVYGVITDAAFAYRKADVSAFKKFLAATKVTFGDVCPTYLQCKDVRNELTIADKARGLKDAQWSHRAFTNAVKSLYGAMPLSSDPAAILKAAKRAADAAEKKNSPEVLGAPKGETQSHPVSAEQLLEQEIARIGIDKVMAALSRMLAVEKSTATQAKAIAAIARQLVKAA